MTELDFTIEFNSSDLFSEQLEHDLFLEADGQLRQLAGEQTDLRGAAINIRAATQVETNPLYEITVVVYARPTDIAVTEKEHDPIMGVLATLLIRIASWLVPSGDGFPLSALTTISMAPRSQDLDK